MKVLFILKVLHRRRGSSIAKKKWGVTFWFHRRQIFLGSSLHVSPCTGRFLHRSLAWTWVGWMKALLQIARRIACQRYQELPGTCSQKFLGINKQAAGSHAGSAFAPAPEGHQPSPAALWDHSSWAMLTTYIWPQKAS